MAKIFDIRGKPISVLDGGILYPGQSGLAIAGSDGTNSHIVLTDSSGRLILSPESGQIAFTYDVKVVKNADGYEASNNSVIATNSSTISVSASTTNVQLLPENTNRLGASIFNNAPSGVLYIGLDVIATPALFTVKIMPNCSWELPYNYTGSINGLWTVASGNTMISEFVRVN